MGERAPRSSLLGSFVPPGAAGGAELAAPHEERAPAALLLADISGFTSLTERLQSRGRQGAEEVASIVNRVFRPAIAGIVRAGGSVASFGGDSILALFPGAGGTRAALEAARAIQAARWSHASAPSLELSIHVAVHHGEVREIHLGTPGRRHYLVAGRATSVLARLEERASADRVALTRAAARQARSERARRPELPRTVADSVARSYLEPRLARALPGFTGAYRRALVGFVESRTAALAPLQRWFLHMRETLDELGGLLVKSDPSAAGTKWIFAFGLLEGHEDDVDRGARAALRIVDGAPSSMAVRAGISAGVVANLAIGSRERRCFDVMGDVVNTAARIMDRARWGEVLLGEELRQQLTGVVTRRRGLGRLKGKSGSTELHALRGAVTGARALQAHTTFTGREVELATIAQLLLAARSGAGGSLVLTGGAGIGKSRLAHEAAAIAEREGMEVHRGRAIPYGGMPYWAVAEAVRGALGLGEVASERAVRARVEAAGSALGLPDVDRRHLAAVLGTRGRDATELPARDVRLNDVLAIGSFFRARAAIRPLLLVVDDLQWADTATRDVLTHLAGGATGTRIALVMAARCERGEPPVPASAGIAELPLRELEGRAVELMIERSSAPPSPAIRELIVERSGGNPLYLEQLLRHVAQGGSAAGGELPSTVEALVAAELDRLPAPARRVLQAGAVIGSSFYRHLLEGLPRLGRHVAAGLATLLERRILVGLRAEPHAEYAFRQTLARDVAYQSLLSSERQRLHEDVAIAMGARFSEAAYLPMRGHHWELAARPARARACYREAALHLASRYALEEASALYARHLSLLRRRSRQGVAMRTELAEQVLLPLGRLRDAAAELTKALADARPLRDRDAEARALVGLGDALQGLGSMEEARSRLEEALARSRRFALRPREMSALVSLAGLHYVQGRQAEAQQLYDAALLLARTLGRPREEGVILGNMANVQTGIRQLDAARGLLEQALAIHRRHGNLRSQAKTIGGIANLEYAQGRLAAARETYARAIAVAREVGDRRVEATMAGNLAVLQWREGRREEARETLLAVREIHRRTGDPRLEAVALSNLAMMSGDAGRLDESRQLYDEALVLVRRIGDQRGQGIVLSNLARIELFASEGGRSFVERADEAAQLLEAIDDRQHLALLACLRGHAALARGESAAAELAAARAAADLLSAGAESELGSSLERLARAEEQRQRGAPLVRGHRREDLTEGQLDWIAARPSRPAPRRGQRKRAPSSGVGTRQDSRLPKRR